MDEILIYKTYTHPRDRIRELKLGSTGARAGKEARLRFIWPTVYQGHIHRLPREECRQHRLECLTTKNCGRSGKHWLQDAPPAVGRKVVNHPLENPLSWPSYTQRIIGKLHFTKTFLPSINQIWRSLLNLNGPLHIVLSVLAGQCESINSVCVQMRLFSLRRLSGYRSKLGETQKVGCDRQRCRRATQSDIVPHIKIF